MKTLSFFIAFLILVSSIIAQVTQQWVKRSSSPGAFNDYARAITYDAAGNVYVTGTGHSDFMTIKYSPEGSVLWSKTYNGPDNDADDANAIFVDASGNVYVTGASFGNGTENDFATIKYDSLGNQLWLQRFSGSNNSDDIAIGIAVDAAGNVYTGGWASTTTGGADFTVVKYSPSGSQLWVRYYNGPNGGADIMRAMTTDQAGNIYVTGSSNGTGIYDFATVKFSPAGTLLWSARTQTGSVDRPADITVDLQSNVYITGYGAGETAEDFVTVKYNNAGVQQWVKKYDRSTNVDKAAGLVIDNATGNLYITGTSTGANNSTDIITIGYSNNGDELWVRSYNGGIVGADDNAADIDIDQFGNIYVFGSVTTSGSDFDYAAVKYSPSGTRLWDIVYESSLNGVDNASAIRVNNGNIFVTGYATGSVSGYDFVTVKYSQPIGIQNVSNEIPQGYELGQNYPNPFNPVTFIVFSVPKSSFTKLAVFDITGKEVTSLVNQQLGAGTYKVDFDAAYLASGTYFYRLEAGGFTEVKKMLMVK